jgi:mRNA-degrading endonuclease RelE of RelBE toxin-antitoxin system
MKLEALTGDLTGLHKLRVGDYRVFYEILQNEQTIVINEHHPGLVRYFE